MVPEALKYADGTPVAQDWNRIMTTMFNGASNVVQVGSVVCEAAVVGALRLV